MTDDELKVLEALTEKATPEFLDRLIHFVDAHNNGDLAILQFNEVQRLIDMAFAFTPLLTEVRELRAQNTKWSAECNSLAEQLAQARHGINKSLCAVCDTLLAQASETQGAQVEIVELQDQVAALTAERDAARANEADTLATLDAHKLVMASYVAQIETLTQERNNCRVSFTGVDKLLEQAIAERDAYRDALQDVHFNFKSGLLNGTHLKPETHAAIDKAIGACSKCGQIPNGQHGEYPCEVCGFPTVWDKE